MAAMCGSSRRRDVTDADDARANTRNDDTSSSMCDCYVVDVPMEVVTPSIEHSEGPHWDQTYGVLYYVDTFQATVYSYNPEAAEDEKVNHNKLEGRNSVGIIIPVKGRCDEFVVTADRNIYKLKWDAGSNNTGIMEEIIAVDKNKPSNQFNDGKADIRGRLWTGTLTREPDLSVFPHGGSFFAIDLKKEQVQKLIYGTSISNGLAWSSDNKRFFFCDSKTHEIHVYECDVHKVKLGEKRVLFNLKKFPEYPGIMDGLTIDNNDNLWIALFGGGGVIQVDGNTGCLLKYIKLPVTYCTSACFGGPSQDILFVTTSKLHLNEEERIKEPAAGSVFALYDLGVKGPAPYDCIL